MHIKFEEQLAINNFKYFYFYYLQLKEKTDYKVHILLQGSKTPNQTQPSGSISTPSTSRAGSEPSETQDKSTENKESTENNDSEKPDLPATPSAPSAPSVPSTPTVPTVPSTPTMSSGGQYACHACPFTTTRLNVLILHNKTHSVSYIPYIPTPIKKKPVHKTVKTNPVTPKPPKPKKPRQEKPEKVNKKPQSQKRPAETEPASEVKKPKTDEEIKSSLLADWDDGDEESNDESSPMVMPRSPELPVAAESPAVPTPAELPSAQIPEETQTLQKKSNESTPAEKPESSSDSKYEFCEDEPDWPVEADIGRKIPRVKNPSKRKSETKSVSIDDDEMAREVAELLNKTTVPELPSAPEPLKVEENFPEPSIVKSPDKQAEKPQDQSSPEKKSINDIQPPKTIFKTKTFFRSRHSRSQDAIGKYVAEQLNAAERMDLAESELNGADVSPSLEIRVSPPIEHVKVARLAPKIQLKKMKAEAAQLRERERYNAEKFKDESIFNTYTNNVKLETSILNTLGQSDEKENSVTPMKNEIEPDKILKKDHLEADEQHVRSDLPKLDNTENDFEVTNKIKISMETEVQHNEKESLTQDIKCESKVEIHDSSEIKTNDNKSEEILEKSYVPFMNESTASAVDALLSVSRETDRVTKVISDDPPEDLFEEDIKDNSSLNGFNTVTHKDYEEIDESYKQQNSEEKSILTETDSASAEESNNETVNIIQEKNNINKTLTHNETSDIKHIENDNLPNLPNKTVDIIESKNNGPPNQTRNENVDIIQADNGSPPKLLHNEIVDIIQSKHDSPSNRLQLFSPQECKSISDVIDAQGTSTTMATIIENTVEETVSHPLPTKNDMKEVVGQNLPADNESVLEQYVSNDLNKCYPTENNTLSESDLQIAEALINLPTTTLQNKSLNRHDNNTLPEPVEDIGPENTDDNSFTDVNKFNELEEVKTSVATLLESDIHIKNDIKRERFETEQEKSENLNAAKSLVQMSETIDHNIKISDIPPDQKNSKELLSVLKNEENDVKFSSEPSAKPNIEVISKVSEVITKVSSESDKKIISIKNESKQNSSLLLPKPTELDTHSSKLLKILEEPCVPKTSPVKKTITKKVIIPGKEKILNFEVGQSIIKPKPQPAKQKIIIRRTASNKTLLNNITEVTTPDKIILSRTSKPAQDGSPVQTYTIQTTPESPRSADGNTFIIQQKIRKISKPMSKLQKIKSPPLQVPTVAAVTEKKAQDSKSKSKDEIFDINSMPVVLSDDILTPESIEKMPIVMSDGNLITNSSNQPKLIKSTKPVENEKLAINAVTTKSEIKTLLMNSGNEVSKVTTPNILSKSSKLRGGKPMLVIDKVTGKQKIIMTKSPESPIKEVKQPQVKQPQTIIQSAPQSSGKAEKFIILPTQSTPRAGKTQKIVIDPQTGKAHVLVGKGTESPLSVAADSKPVSAKLIPSTPDTSTPGNTIMIITNAQGTQSRIVLTPEHEKILFPNKQQNLTPHKTVTHRVTAGASSVQRPAAAPNPTKTQTRVVPKQKSAIITSKGQLIVGGRIATTTQNIAPLPEIRPAPKRVPAAETKKLVQTIQKNPSERLIFLQQKSGAVMQLTAAQFEHLQKTGQIVHKAPQEKMMVQKSITISPNEPVAVPAAPKQRVRKATGDSPTPTKKVKHEIAIAPAPAALVPALTPLSNTIPPIVSTIPSAPIGASGGTYSELDNIEDIIPSTAIVRPPQAETVATQAAPLADPGQLLAVPGEHFGGPPGSFYLCVEENGTYTVIDPRPLILENNQLVPMAEPLPVLAQPERRDILEAALANSDVFHADTSRDEAPDFRDLNANVSVNCRVSETSTTLNQPIMTPVEVPSKGGSEPAVPSTLEDGLAVIGVTPLTVPTSLELPITVTDPRIVPKTTDPLSNNNYGAALLSSPNTEMTFATTEQMEVSVVGPISMPILTDDDAVGKSMPILTDEVTDRTVSSVESTVGSPSSIDVRESENEDSASGQWPRRLLTPCSDTSETSAEIPLQPVMQISVNDLSHNS